MIEHMFCFVNGRALVWCLFYAPESDRIDPEDRRNNSAGPGVSDAGQTDCAPGGSRPLLAADDLDGWFADPALLLGEYERRAHEAPSPACGGASHIVRGPD